jgi:uncharacterized protein with HEPN domain
MRSEELYLSDIIEAADSIAGFLGGAGRDEFFRDELLRSAVLQKLMVIGEAAAHVGETIRAKHTQVPWRRIAAFRNYAIHEYFGMNWAYAWIAATEDTPLLRSQVQTVLEAEFGR